MYFFKNLFFNNQTRRGELNTWYFVLNTAFSPYQNLLSFRFIILQTSARYSKAQKRGVLVRHNKQYYNERNITNGPNICYILVISRHKYATAHSKAALSQIGGQITSEFKI